MVRIAHLQISLTPRFPELFSSGIFLVFFLISSPSPLCLQSSPSPGKMSGWVRGRAGTEDLRQTETACHNGTEVRGFLWSLSQTAPRLPGASPCTRPCRGECKDRCPPMARGGRRGQWWGGGQPLVSPGGRPPAQVPPSVTRPASPVSSRGRVGPVRTSACSCPAACGLVGKLPPRAFKSPVQFRRRYKKTTTTTLNNKKVKR